MNIRYIKQEAAVDSVIQNFVNGMQTKYSDNIKFVNLKKDFIQSYEIGIVDFKLYENGIDLGGTSLFIFLGNEDLIVLSFMAGNKDGSYRRYRHTFELFAQSIQISS